MRLPNIVPLCLISFHLIECLYTPAGLRALAAIHGQRARAIANAVNLRARAQYNAAMARSRASNSGLLDRRVIRDSNRYLESPPENQFQGEGFYNENYYSQNPGQAFAQQVGNSGVEENFGSAEQPEYSCMVEEFEEEINPDDLPHISVNFNKDYIPPTYEVPQGVPPSFGGVEECPGCQPGMGGQENSALPQNDYDAREATPHIRPHSHFHSHTHGTVYGGKLIQPPIYAPSSHVITPGVNLNVVQNQNAAATTHTGYGSALVNSLPAIHNAGKELLHHVGVGVNPGLVPNIGHGTNIVQSQTVQTHNVPIAPGGGHYGTGTGVGGGSVIQTQNVHQGARDAEGLDDMEMVGMPKKGAEDNFNDEKLGTFSTNYMKAPEFNKYSDMGVPQNRQGIVKYLENEQILHQILPYDKIHTAKQSLLPSHGFKSKPQYFSDYIKLGTSNSDNEKLGTFLVDPSRLEPIPTLPRNFVELDSEHRREAIMNILNTEQRNFHKMFVPIDHDSNNFEKVIENHNVDNSGFVPTSNQHDSSNFERLIENHHQDNPGLVPEVNLQDEFQNMEKLKHFHEFSEDPESQFDLSDMDDQFRLGATHQTEKTKEEKEENVPEMLTKLIENDADTQKKIGMPPQEYPVLGNLFQAPTMRYSDDYLRLARSLNSSKVKDLDELLGKERNLINSLKKNAKHDEDLMMIGYIGDSLIDDFEKRINNIRRKREIGRPSLPINRLIMDPKTRLDIPKTLENIGAVTKTAFEYEKAPLYHVRNMMGSAQDAMMAAMKIPTTNFLIPSTYQIANTQNQKLGAINPSILRNNDGSNSNLASGDGIVDTFNRVGSAVRESVMSGQEALGHVGQMANHAKTAIYSGRYASPRIILKQIPHITREPTKKAMIITPRIFDIAHDDGNVGSTLGTPQPDFVKLGHIFDAVGLSNPNVKNVEFEKIVIEPKGPLPHFEGLDSIHSAKLLKTFRNMLEGVRVEAAKEEDFVGSALNAIDDVRTTIGADSLRDFIVKMRERMATSLKNPGKGIIQNTSLKKDATPKTPASGQSNPDQSTPHHERSSRTAESQWPPNQDYLGFSLFPQHLTQPYMGQASEPLLHEPHQRLHEEEKDNHAANEDIHHHDKISADKHLGHILGAINPMMFEKMFNESLTNRNSSDSPHAIFHHHHEGRSHGHHHTEEEDLGTSMAITGQMLRPFMGQPSKKMQDDFFGKYKMDGEESPQYIEFEDVPGAQWTDVLNPIQESDLEYDE